MSNESHPSPTGSSSSSLFGFDQFDSSSPTTDWTKPVTTNTNSSANGWSNFPQQQQQQQQHQNISHPSRSNAPGNSNVSSNQWPQIDNFYGPSSSAGGSFNLPTNNNNNSDTMNNNSASLSTWQDPSASGNAGETMNMTSSNSSVINKHKSSSNASMAASLSVALKSAIASGGATADLPGGNGDPSTPVVPQPRLVEQLGWDEPDIKVAKRPAFDDGTSIWGDPMESAAVPVKKWTNGTKTALSNSTNIVVQQPQPSAVQKPVSTGTNQGSNATPPSTQMSMNNENWPKQQSPTIISQPAPSSSSSSSQWNEASASNDQISLGSASQQQMNYRSQQSNNSNWNPLPQASGGHGGSDDWIRDGVVDTSDWCLHNSQNKVPFDPFDGKVDTSDWVVSGGASGGMGGQLPMSSMNRNRFGQDYDLNEGSHDPHNVHRLSNFDTSPMGDPYRQGSDLKNPIIGVGSLLPSAGGNPQLPHHMLPPSQLPFNARPGPMYQQGGILRPINPNGIPTQSGAIMGTGGLISPKLSTTSPVPNQAPYVPLAGKPGNVSNQAFPSGGSQQQGQGGASGGGGGAGAAPMNNGAVHAQIMQQFRLAVQAGLISQDLLNTKLPPFMLQLLQKLFELQQKYQALSIQLADFAKHKQRFPITFFQSEYERLSKLLSQKKQEMLMVQKQIHDAHTKLKQQQQSTNSTPTPSQMMVNGPATQSQTGAGVSSGGSQESQHGLTTDHSRLHQWTKSGAGGGNTRSGQTQASMFGPPGLTRKDWDNSNNNLNENWENTPTNDSANSSSNNPGANVDAHIHNSQGASSAFPDPLADFVDDNDGPPPFVPGQLWNWKASLPSADDDPHVTPSSLTLASKGSSTSISSMNASGNESAFSNPQLMQRQQQQQQRSQWQQSLQDQQAFQGASMSDWGKPQQFRGPPKGPSSLNHPPPPPHTSFGGYRPYM